MLDLVFVPEGPSIDNKAWSCRLWIVGISSMAIKCPVTIGQNLQFMKG